MGLVLVGTAVAATFAVAVYVRARGLSREAFRRDLVLRAEALAGAMSIGPEGIDWEVPLERMPEYRRVGSGQWFLMYYPKGEVFGRSPSLGGELMPPPPVWEKDRIEYREIEDGPGGAPAGVATLSFLAKVEKPEADEEPWSPPPEPALRFRIQVGADTTARDAELSRLALFLGLSGGALVLVTVGLGFLVARRILRPVRRMTAEAATLGPDAPGRRLAPDAVVAELHGLATTLNAALDRLGDALERERRFTSDVSHELRTPVSVLLTNSEHLLRRERSAEEYREGIERQHRTAVRMREVTANLLTLARADAASNGIATERIDVGLVLGTIVEELATTAEDRGVRLECEVAEGLAVRGDRAYLAQLATNLLSNALKFTPRGGRVSLTGRREEGRVVIEVSDTGPGIAPEEQGAIFERFHRVGGGRDRREGAGLGLAIVDWIVRAHGGTISVASRPGEGATFTVELPAAD